MAALLHAGVPTKCQTISSALDALKLLNNGTTPDAIFLDLNMPLMNGHQFLAELCKLPQFSHVPVYVLSTSSHPSAIDQSKRLGATAFITKPDKFEEFADILKSVLTTS